MTTAQVGYTPVYRWVKQVLGDTHTTVVATVAWAVLCLLVAQRVTSAALARALPADAGRLRPVVPPAGAALVAGAGARSGHDQSGLHPPGADARDGGPARGGGPGHAPGSGPGKSGWPASSSPGARSRLAGRSSPIPGPRGASGRRRWRSSSSSSRPSPAGVRWTLVADRGFPSAGSSPSCARAARTSACGCG